MGHSWGHAPNRKKRMLFVCVQNRPTQFDPPPLPGERRNPVVRPLESQIDKIFVELLEAASLLTGFGRLGLEPTGELMGVWVGAAGGLALRIGRLGGFRAQVAPDGVAGDAEPLGNFPQRDLVAEVPASDYS